MSRRWAGVLIAVAALVLIATISLLRRPSRPAPRLDTSTPTPTAAGTPAPAEMPEESRRVALWLPAGGGRIAPLEVEVSSAPEPGARIDALLRALFAARPEPPLSPVFDPPVELAATMRGPRATLYVDIASRDGAPPPGSGSTHELQRVYSIVHTVVRNEPSIERVVLLWNGVQRDSLAGHVDTGHALEPRPELEAASPASPIDRPAPPPAEEPAP